MIVLKKTKTKDASEDAEKGQFSYAAAAGVSAFPEVIWKGLENWSYIYYIIQQFYHQYTTFPPPYTKWNMSNTIESQTWSVDRDVCLLMFSVKWLVAFAMLCFLDISASSPLLTFAPLIYDILTACVKAFYWVSELVTVTKNCWPWFLRIQRSRLERRQLRALALLAVDLGWVPNTHMELYIQRVRVLSSGLWGYCIHTLMQNTHT